MIGETPHSPQGPRCFVPTHNGPRVTWRFGTFCRVIQRTLDRIGLCGGGCLEANKSTQAGGRHASGGLAMSWLTGAQPNGSGTRSLRLSTTMSWSRWSGQLDKNLEAIILGRNLEYVVYYLIGWANRVGRIEDLLEAPLRSEPVTTISGLRSGRSAGN